MLGLPILFNMNEQQQHQMLLHQTALSESYFLLYPTPIVGYIRFLFLAVSNSIISVSSVISNSVLSDSVIPFSTFYISCLAFFQFLVLSHSVISDSVISTSTFSLYQILL